MENNTITLSFDENGVLSITIPEAMAYIDSVKLAEALNKVVFDKTMQDTEDEVAHWENRCEDLEEELKQVRADEPQYEDRYELY